MTERQELNARESALLVALLDGYRSGAGDAAALFELQRKNLVQYGPAGWCLTYAGSVLAIEIDEEN